MDDLAPKLETNSHMTSFINNIYIYVIMSCEKLCAKMWRLKMGLGCGSLAGCLAAWFGDENMSSEAQVYPSFGIWHLRQKEFCSDPAGTQNSKLCD